MRFEKCRCSENFFFIYTEKNEKNDIQHTNPEHGYTVFTGMTEESVKDDSAPAGVRRVYRGTLPDDLSQDSHLCFNIAHHEIEVYLARTSMI